MYGRKACQLVKEFAGGEKGQLTPFNSDLFEQVVAECSQHHLELQSLIRKIQEEGLDVQTTRNADHHGALIHHLALVRNKRCLMAYVYNRAEVMQSLLWKIGQVLPQEIEEKLCHSEIEYFKKHSAALRSYMSKVQLDLTVDMVPPKDPYIQVRVLDDIGDGIVLKQFISRAYRLILFYMKNMAWPLILLKTLHLVILDILYKS
ncbi:DNA replication complex GINS protein PSF1 [Senna tora]|uniref:DNA replication complex GINS protein PSF1 n=1 Tax=Senna tora TaxID=362788 RepID=A0A834XCX8_9FABA|nr:DNA replication complex GINS protein PSF1 [Senna tora]